MNFAKVEDGEVTSTSLPESGSLPDGSMVSGFDKLDADTLATAGWLPIEDNGSPFYNTETQTVTRTLEVQGNQVVAVYEITDLPPPPDPEPDPEIAPSVQQQLDTLLAKLVENEVITEGDVGLIKTTMPPEE